MTRQPPGDKAVPKSHTVSPDKAGQRTRREAILATRAAHPQAGSRRIRDVMKRFLAIGTSDTTVRRVLQLQDVAQPRSPAKALRKREGYSVRIVIQ
jgi:hypothetical protein